MNFLAPLLLFVAGCFSQDPDKVNKYDDCQQFKIGPIKSCEDLEMTRCITNVDCYSSEDKLIKSFEWICNGQGACYDEHLDQ